jgi:hypothetical protein
MNLELPLVPSGQSPKRCIALEYIIVEWYALVTQSNAGELHVIHYLNATGPPGEVLPNTSFALHGWRCRITF